jgi:arylformamidase
VSKLIDITLTARADMPHWPGSGGLRIIPSERISEGDDYNVSTLHSDLHVGTHVDAPWHCVSDGRTVDELSLHGLIGPVVVAYLPDLQAITESDLEGLNLPPDERRLLLRTSNSELWLAGVPEFRTDYVALSPGAARWVVDRGLRLLGVDYLSVGRFDEGPEAHRILLGAGVVVLEGLNLAGVEPGRYELLCLPMKLKGADGAPARAVLRNLPSLHGTSAVAGDDP